MTRSSRLFICVSRLILPVLLGASIAAHSQSTPPSKPAGRIRCGFLTVDMPCPDDTSSPGPKGTGTDSDAIRAAAAAAAAAAERKRKADEADQQGLEAANRGDWREAANRFMEALVFAPDSPEIRAHLDRANTALADAGSAAEILALRQRIEDAIAAANIKVLRERLEDDVAAQRLTAMSENLWRGAGSAAPTNEQIAAIVREIRKIQVPPPILPQEASIAIGQLAPGDKTSQKILLGLEIGVATADVLETIGEKTLPWVKLIVATGKTVIAAEDAADVYLVKQTAVYEKALKHLRDEKGRKEFTTIVRALKEHRPVPETAKIEMVRTAEAILDPKLGNSGIRIAWNAMLSPEARRAAVTEACIQLGGELLGATAGHAFQHIQSTQYPAFREAKDFLKHAAVAMKHVKDPAAKKSLKIAVDQANQVIAGTYRTLRPSVKGVEHLESIYAKEREEEYRTKKPE